MKLYELQEQLVQIDNILESNTNPETDEILESAKEQLLAEIDGNMENILNYISDCKAKADQLKAEEERLYKKRKAVERKIAYLKGLVFGQLKLSGENKSEYGTWAVSITKTPARVVLDACDDNFPEKYKKYSWDIDKTALKNDMENDKLVIFDVASGKEIQLAHLESGETLRIK